MMPGVGDVIGGKYRIVRLIGDGGMGTVYEAHHEFLETTVALKFLHTELAKRAGLGSRFLQEARVSARIRSPHVTHVTDVDQTADGSPYLVMELLHGEPLQQLMDRRGKLPVEQAVDFALQILSGLESAHAIGVVHRDLKPDNVFIVPATGGPLLKLIDFGIAKLRASTAFQKGLTRAGVGTCCAFATGGGAFDGDTCAGSGLAASRPAWLSAPANCAKATRISCALPQRCSRSGCNARSMIAIKPGARLGSRFAK